MGLLEGWGDEPLDVFETTRRLRGAGKEGQTGATTGYTPAQPGGAGGGRGGFWLQPQQPEYFNLPQFAAAQGFDPRTPTGQAMPSANMQAWQKFIETYYPGMTGETFLAGSPEERYAAWAGGKGMAGTEEEYRQTLVGGVPQKTPGSPQEASWAQFYGGLAKREQEMQLLNRALATSAGGEALARQGEPGSVQAALSPLRAQRAGILAGTEVTAPDYSYWAIPQTPTPTPREERQGMMTQVPQTIGGGGQQGGQQQMMQLLMQLLGGQQGGGGGGGGYDRWEQMMFGPWQRNQPAGQEGGSITMEQGKELLAQLASAGAWS